MKKIDKKKAKKFTFIVVSRVSLILLFVGLFVVMPLISIVYDSRQQALSDKFFGKKAEYQGIITLWNVDTFEGGSMSRASYLDRVAVLFEKQNKGVFIKVENLTIDEMLANIKMGKYPDLYAFGTGVGNVLKDKMLELPSTFASLVRANFYSSGLEGGVQKAIAYAVGGYCLISTSQKIEDAGEEVTEDLMSLAFKLSYDKTYKKSTKHITSLTFGKNDYTNALDVFSRTFTSSSVVELQKKGVVDENYSSQSPYYAYLNFINGKSSMLLGTQRDIFRMENRLQAGVEGDVLYQPLGAYTDLVSYISVLAGEKSKVNVCVDFVEFLLGDTCQKLLADIGMLSPTNLSLYEEGVLKQLEDSITEQTLVKAGF